MRIALTPALILLATGLMAAETPAPAPGPGATIDPNRPAAARADAAHAKAMADMDAELAKLAGEDPVRALLPKAQAAADKAESADSVAGGGGAVPAAGAAIAAAPVEPPNLVTTAGGDPMMQVQDIISGLGLAGGVQQKGPVTVIVATAAVQVQGTPGGPTWSAARVNAYNIAEIQARAEIARSLSEEVLSGRDVDVMSRCGAIEDPTLPPRSRDEIAKAAAALDETGLDAQLAKLGVPAQRRTGISTEQKRVVMAEAYASYIQSRAATALSGCATLAVCEGPAVGNQMLSVAIVWSSNMARLAGFFYRHGGELPPRPPKVGARLTEQVPRDPLRLSRTFGVQRLVDETGEIVLVAYGQAPLDRVPAAMRATALSAAYGKARMEASSMMKAFVFESTSVNASLKSAQLAAVVEGVASGAQTTSVQQASNYNQSIRSGGDTLNLQGVSTLYQWSGRIDGSDVAGVVLQWSPRSLRQAAEAAAQTGGGAAGQPAAPVKPGFDPSW
jgi:hypothetical protein